MRDELKARVLALPYTREEVSIKHFYRQSRHRQFERMAVGSFTATDLVAKHKYVDSEAWMVTDFELARQYLNVLWEQRGDQERKRVAFSKETYEFLKLQPPAWFVGPTRGELAYVDIKSCYFQLYSPLTLDLRFRSDPGVFMLGSAPFIALDWLRSEKMVRNGIVGIARSTKRGEWCRGEYREVQSYNKFLAPELWGYLMHTLHAVAHEAIKHFPIHYWNTDGCILDADRAGDLCQYLADEWRLEANVRASGNGAVYGFASYEIENVRTARLRASKLMENLHPYDPALAARLKRWRGWALDRG